MLALNIGEILREFGEILGKYRILDERSMGSIGLSLDGEPPQKIIGWTKNDENENGCLFRQKTDYLCFYTN